MKLKWILAVAVAALLLQFSSTAQAFECPKHIAEAQAAIEKAIASVMGMESKMSKEGITYGAVPYRPCQDDPGGGEISP